MTASRRRAAPRYRRPRSIEVVQSGDDAFTVGRGGRAALLNQDLLEIWLAVDGEIFATVTAIYGRLHPRLQQTYSRREVAAALDGLLASGLLETPAVGTGYDSVAAQYDARPPYGERVFDAILRHTTAAHRARILDVGCGTGGVLERLAPLATEWCGGIEPSRGMLDIARRRLRTVGNVELQLGGAETLPFASGSVTLMVIAQALHWFDAARFWPEAERVLAPEHRVVAVWRLIDLSADNPVARYMWEYGGKQLEATTYFSTLGQQLPASMGLIHFERSRDSFTLANPAQAVAMFQSWAMPSATQLSAAQVEAGFLAQCRADDPWPLEVPCVLVVAVLIRQRPHDLGPHRGPLSPG